MAYNLADYETVESRLVKFWADHPDGQIHTELIDWTDGNFIVKAGVLVDGRLIATGLAQEKLGGSGANKDAALENCETSAIGRALANMNYATKRTSREEMEKVARGEKAVATAPAAPTLSQGAQDVVERLKEISAIESPSEKIQAVANLKQTADTDILREQTLYKGHMTSLARIADNIATDALGGAA